MAGWIGKILRVNLSKNTWAVEDLDPDLASQLGYEINGSSRSRRLRLNLPAIKIDPRVERMPAQLSQDVRTRFQGAAVGILCAFIALAVLMHFFFCYCCLLICRKAGTPPGLLIWFPFFQLFPLFRAARMSYWSVFGLCTPQLFGVVAAVTAPGSVDPNSPKVLLLLVLGLISLLVPAAIVTRWCIKICRARNKSGWLALLLLLPPTSLFAFLYLAFSNGEEEEAALPNPGYVTFTR